MIKKKSKAHWYVLCTTLLLLIATILFVRYWLFGDSLSSAFDELTDGMSQEKVLKTVNAYCPECDVIVEKDDQKPWRTHITFLRNGGVILEHTEIRLPKEYLIQYANTSSLWLQFEDGWLRDAERTQNLQFILNSPPVEGENTDFRGYMGSVNECLAKDCRKKWNANINLLTATERAGIRKFRENRQKNKWWLCQKTGICL